MLRLQTKIAALKSIKSSSSSTSPYQLLLRRVQRTSSASYRGNFHKPSSFFSPKSTSPISNRKRQLAEPLPYSAYWVKFDANQVKYCSNESIQSDSRPPDSSFIQSLSNLVKNKNYPEAIYCYKFSSSSGLPSNFFILNILLNSYCNMKLASGCGFSVFGVILKKGFTPNTITFTSLIKGLCLEEKIAEASKLFKKMIQLGFNPNVVTCTTLISGLCNAGNSTAALNLHREMLNGKLSFGGQRVNPTLVSYGSLIDGFCKAGLLAKANELFLEMKSSGISPNVVVYTSLLNGLCLSGRWVEARFLYQEMVDDGIQANAMTLHSILSSLCKQGNAKKATDLIARGGDPNDLVHKILMEIKEN